MSTPSKLRKTFIEAAAPIIDDYIGAGLGDKTFKSISGEARAEVWDTIKQIILKADDPVTIAWTDKDTRERVDEVLSRVAAGDITPDEGQKLIALISMGLEPVELANLAKAVEALKGTP